MRDTQELHRQRGARQMRKEPVFLAGAWGRAPGWEEAEHFRGAEGPGKSEERNPKAEMRGSSGGDWWWCPCAMVAVKRVVLSGVTDGDVWWGHTWWRGCVVMRLLAIWCVVMVPCVP